MPYIYKTTNLVNGKIYIGKALEPKQGYLGSGIKLAGAIKKYGRNNFKKEILEECSIDNIDAREIYWIDILNARDDIVGYNISIGGTGGDHYWKSLDDVSREKHREKISKSKTGAVIKYSETQRRNVREALRLYNRNKTTEQYKEIRLKSVKKYVILKEGTIYRTKGLSKFCKEHNLRLAGLTSIATGNRIYPDNGYYCFYDTGGTDDEFFKKILFLEKQQIDRKNSWLQKTRARKKVCCEHCGKSVSPTNLVRWHGNKCKQK